MSIEVKYLTHTVTLSSEETVLDALERVGAAIPSSCRAGACQSCIMKATFGQVPKNAQDGLRDSLRQTGHFLSCICRPLDNLVCEPAYAADFRDYVAINEICEIGPDVVRVRFARPAKFEFTPGQFVTLKRHDGVARSYSLASSQHERDYFDVHVRRVPNGRLSCWLHDEAVVGEKLWLEGPKGDCVYRPEDPREPLTLIGTGTGIAPLFSIATDALEQGHQGPISIYHGAVAQDRFYLSYELRTLSKVYSNVSYKPCVVKGPVQDDIVIGDLKDIVTAELSDAQWRRVYLCGDPGLVRSLKRHLFLAGISLKRIHADPFIGADERGVR